MKKIFKNNRKEVFLLKMVNVVGVGFVGSEVVW